MSVLNFPVVSMNFLPQEYPQLLFLLTTKPVVLNGRKRLVSSELSRRSLTSWMRIARESGMSSENHKNSVLLRICLTG